MSVVIKGMEMPKDCWGCAVQGIPACFKHLDFSTRGKRPAGCPLAEVPDSGWIPIKSRPMDDEERQYYSEHYGYKLTDEEAVIYCSQLPEHGQEVLVCSMYGHIWKDTFDDDPDYGVGFEENGDMDGIVAWMPLPEPYKAEEGE